MSAIINGIYVECKSETEGAISQAEALARCPQATCGDLSVLIKHHVNQARVGSDFDLNVFLADIYSAARERRFESSDGTLQNYER